MSIEAGQDLLHYRLVERIGEGGMGVVWKAVDPSVSDTLLSTTAATSLLLLGSTQGRDVSGPAGVPLRAAAVLAQNIKLPEHA